MLRRPSARRVAALFADLQSAATGLFMSPPRMSTTPRPRAASFFLAVASAVCHASPAAPTTSHREALQSLGATPK
ncbi:MAG: hypothetical protein EOO65_00045 [Methanosarcinales archaeon]|nr:MAG: hypothetical protein EOO65_00045 [Methanosarcinales archaeon]